MQGEPGGMWRPGPHPRGKGRPERSGVRWEDPTGGGGGGSDKLCRVAGPTTAHFHQTGGRGLSVGLHKPLVKMLDGTSVSI